MSDFNIQKILFALRPENLFLKKIIPNEQQKTVNFQSEFNNGLNSGTKPQTNNFLQANNINSYLNKPLEMNTFLHTDRSVFIKNILGLPQNLSEILKNAQNFNRPLPGGTLGVGSLNPDLISNQKALSEIFKEITPAAINPDIAAITAQTQAKPDAVALIFGGMISMPEISKIILQNGKQAAAALVIAMASASKNGVDVKQLQETLKIVNSCISMAESESPAQNLKSLMMLYLPWLPLNEGVGFDLEITPPDGENESNDSKLTVLIQTKNYGNLKGVFTLTTSNSVDVYIICSDKFPKKTLNKLLKEEGTTHSMNTNIDIEDVVPLKEEPNETRETKVNLSATNEMNPYLLLMAHSFIRNTILIDNGEA